MTPFAIGGLQLNVSGLRDNLPYMQAKLDYFMYLFPWVQMVVFSELAAYGPNPAKAEPLPGPARAQVSGDGRQAQDLDGQRLARRAAQREEVQHAVGDRPDGQSHRPLSQDVSVPAVRRRDRMRQFVLRLRCPGRRAIRRFHLLRHVVSRDVADVGQHGRGSHPAPDLDHDDRPRRRTVDRPRDGRDESVLHGGHQRRGRRRQRTLDHLRPGRRRAAPIRHVRRTCPAGNRSRSCPPVSRSGTSRPGAAA